LTVIDKQTIRKKLNTNHKHTYTLAYTDYTKDYTGEPAAPVYTDTQQSSQYESMNINCCYIRQVPRYATDPSLSLRCVFTAD